METYAGLKERLVQRAVRPFGEQRLDFGPVLAPMGGEQRGVVVALLAGQHRGRVASHAAGAEILNRGAVGRGGDCAGGSQRQRCRNQPGNRLGLHQVSVQSSHRRHSERLSAGRSSSASSEGA